MFLYFLQTFGARMPYRCSGFQFTRLIRDGIWKQASLAIIAPFHPFPRAAKLMARANAHPAGTSACCNERGNVNLAVSFHEHRSCRLHTQKEDKNNFLPAYTTQDLLSPDKHEPKQLNQLVSRAAGAAPASQYIQNRAAENCKIYTFNTVKLFQIATCCFSNLCLSPWLLFPMKP